MCSKRWICAGCCCFTVVLIGVMVPVTIFAIMPQMAQGNLDSAGVLLNNVTMLPCDNFAIGAVPEVEVINDVTFKSSAPLSAVLHEYQMTLTTYVCQGKPGTSPLAGYTCKNPTPLRLGTFTQPEVNLASGSTNVKNTVSLKVTAPPSAMMSSFIFPILIGTLPNQTTRLIMSSDNVAVSVLGIKIGHLKLHKDLVCKMLEGGNPPSPIAPNPVTSSKYCVNSTAGQVTGIMMSCKESGASDYAAIEERAITSKDNAAPACTGSKYPPSPAPFCYSGGELGEALTVKVTSFAGGRGTFDVTGSGIEKMNCMAKPFTMSGQTFIADLSDCVHTIGISSIEYCSSQDHVLVTAKLGRVPAVVLLKRTLCSAVFVV